MKKFSAILAAAAALLCTTSCSDVIEAIQNNYYCGTHCVIVGSATISDDPDVDLCAIRLTPKDETAEHDYYNIIMSSTQYHQAMTSEVSIPDGLIGIDSHANNGQASVVVLGEKYDVVLGSEYKDVYNTMPVKYEGTLRVESRSDKTVKITVKASVTLSKKADATQTEQISLNAVFTGTPEYN